jgi:hypothetical protein
VIDPREDSSASERDFGHGGWAGDEFWITPSCGVCFALVTNLGGGVGRFGVDVDQLHNAVAAAA